MKAESLEVRLGSRSYPIHIGRGIAGDPTLYAPHVAGRRAALVTSEAVAGLHAAKVEQAMANDLADGESGGWVENAFVGTLAGHGPPIWRLRRTRQGRARQAWAALLEARDRPRPAQGC